MIKTIIFDFGGVIGTDADIIFIEVLEENGISKERAIEIFEKHWPKFKVGGEGVKEVWKSVEIEFGQDISKILKEYESRVEVYPDVLELCKQLKDQGFKLGVLANESREWMNIKREKGNLNQKFDKVYSSADINIPKPNEESYKFILKELASKPEETLFIDNMERNTKAAEKIGLKTILYTNLDQLKKELVSFGISIN